MLQTASFAGFSFAQSLVVSLQRYTPGFMLFPFIEPTVMRTGQDGSNGDQLRAILSLTVKVDLIVIGAAIVGCFTAAPQIVGILAGSKYVAQATALPWLLMIIVANSSYRALEIAAVKVGLGHQLVRMLPVSIFWLGLMAACGSRFGLWPLLIAPIADATFRLLFLDLMIKKGSGVSIIDGRRCLYIVICISLFSVAGRCAGKYFLLDKFQFIALVTGMSVGYLLATMLLRPISYDEGALLRVIHPLFDKIIPHIRTRAR